MNRRHKACRAPRLQPAILPHPRFPAANGASRPRPPLLSLRLLRSTTLTPPWPSAPLPRRPRGSLSSTFQQILLPTTDTPGLVICGLSNSPRKLFSFAKLEIPSFAFLPPPASLRQHLWPDVHRRLAWMLFGESNDEFFFWSTILYILFEMIVWFDCCVTWWEYVITFSEICTMWSNGSIFREEKSFLSIGIYSLSIAVHRLAATSGMKQRIEEEESFFLAKSIYCSANVLLWLWSKLLI